MMQKSLLILAVLCTLPACSDTQSEASFPKGAKEERRLERGSLTGDAGFFNFGGSEEEKPEKASPLGVNAFLWRGTLDTLSFMPLVSADPFGGTILTDWYEDPKAPGERYKVNAVILDKTLRADGVRISVFKQKLDANGAWREQPGDETLARKLENTILTRARQLRVAQLGR